MKKLLLTAFLVSIPYCAYSFVGEFSPADVIQVHDMQMINEQRFKMEQQFDENESLQEEKTRYWKKNKSPNKQVEETKEQIQQKQQQVIQPSKHSEFIQENGQIKIKYY